MPEDLWARLRELADRTAKTVLAFRVSEDGQLDLQTTTDIRTLILCLHQLGQDVSANAVEAEFKAFGEAAKDCLEWEDDALHKVGEDAIPDWENSQAELDHIQSAFAARLRSLELMAPVQSARAGAVASPANETGFGLHDGTKGGYEGRLARIRKQQEKKMKLPASNDSCDD